MKYGFLQGVGRNAKNPAQVLPIQDFIQYQAITPYCPAKFYGFILLPKQKLTTIF
ncbi:MAG TPA: hypothetical protein VG738_01835 [Chitinophagaceae bacterium]|nr:hypothetical protein [Chitinophagaceae bacterium]